MKTASQDVGSNGFALEKQHGGFAANRRQAKRWMKKRFKGHMTCEDLVNAAVYKGGFCGSWDYLSNIALEVIMGI